MDVPETYVTVFQNSLAATQAEP